MNKCLLTCCLFCFSFSLVAQLKTGLCIELGYLSKINPSVSRSESFLHNYQEAVDIGFGGGVYINPKTYCGVGFKRGLYTGIKTYSFYADAYHRFNSNIVSMYVNPRLGVSKVSKTYFNLLYDDVVIGETALYCELNIGLSIKVYNNVDITISSGISRMEFASSIPFRLGVIFKN